MIVTIKKCNLPYVFKFMTYQTSIKSFLIDKCYLVFFNKIKFSIIQHSFNYLDVFYLLLILKEFLKFLNSFHNEIGL